MVTSAAGHCHVVGAGLAGLAAATALAEAGQPVSLYEASGHAGGRCRSYFDADLGCRVDNGNHLLLSGNRAALVYLGRIGALDTLTGPNEAFFWFVDAASGERWTLRPNRGPIPWWIGSAARRVPGSAAADYLAAVGLRRAPAAATVIEAIDPDRPLFRRLWQPLAVAALNTAADAASARLFWRILAETLGRGAAACRPLVPRDSLSQSFVDPALDRLQTSGAEIRLGARLREIAFDPDLIRALDFDGGVIELGPRDIVVLAVTAAVAGRLVPGLLVPDVASPIVNAHFRFPTPAHAPPFVGVVGGTAQWVFRKREVLSVTVSAADGIIDEPAATLCDRLWHDTALAYRLPARSIPPSRIVKERRATFRASPDQLLRRPRTATRWRNLYLAGDYTDTGLPATIEGAIRSGLSAAGLALGETRQEGRRVRQ